MGGLERRITRLESRLEPRGGNVPEWAVREALARLSDEEFYELAAIVESSEEEMFLGEEHLRASPAVRRFCVLVEEVLEYGVKR